MSFKISVFTTILTVKSNVMAQPIQVTTLQLIKMAMLSRGIFIVGQKANPKDPISKGWPTQ